MTTWALIGRELHSLADARHRTDWDGRTVASPDLERFGWVDPDRTLAPPDDLALALDAMASGWDPADLDASVTARRLAACLTAPARPSVRLVRAVGAAFDTPLGVGLGAEVVATAAAAAPLLCQDRLATFVEHAARAERAFAPPPPARLRAALRRALGPLPEARRAALLRDLWNQAHAGADEAPDEQQRWHGERWRPVRPTFLSERPDLGDGPHATGDLTTAWLACSGPERTRWFECLLPFTRWCLLHRIPDDTRLHSSTVASLTPAELGVALRRGLSPEHTEAAIRQVGPDVELALAHGCWVPGPPEWDDAPSVDPCAVGRLLSIRHRTTLHELFHHHPSAVVGALAAAGEAVPAAWLRDERLAPAALVLAAAAQPASDVTELVRSHPSDHLALALVSAAPRVTATGAPWVPRDLLDAVLDRFPGDDPRRPLAVAVLATHLLPGDDDRHVDRWDARLRTALRAAPYARYHRGRHQQDPRWVGVDLPTHDWEGGVHAVLVTAHPSVRLRWWRAGILADRHLAAADLHAAPLTRSEAVRLGSGQPQLALGVAGVIDLPPGARPTSPLVPDAERAAAAVEFAGDVPPRARRWSDLVDITLTSPYPYPDAIRRLDGQAIDGGAGWVLRLPRTPAELRANGQWMGNCTFDIYEEDVAAGESVILVIDSDARRWNAELRRAGEGWRLTEVNGRFNRDDAPTELRDRLVSVAAAVSRGEREAPPIHERFDHVGPPPRRRPPFAVRAHARRTRHRRPSVQRR